MLCFTVSVNDVEVGGRAMRSTEPADDRKTTDDGRSGQAAEPLGASRVHRGHRSLVVDQREARLAPRMQRRRGRQVLSSFGTRHDLRTAEKRVSRVIPGAPTQAA